MMYTIIYDLSNRNRLNFKWLNNIKEIFCLLGFSGVWNIEIKHGSSKALIQSQILAKECALCTGKLPRWLAQEQFGYVNRPRSK